MLSQDDSRYMFLFLFFSPLFVSFFCDFCDFYSDASNDNDNDNDDNDGNDNEGSSAAATAVRSVRISQRPVRAAASRKYFTTHFFSSFSLSVCLELTFKS